MNLLLSVGDWFAQNWMIILLIVVAVGLMVPTYLKQKKEVNARNDLNNQIVKGAKIITTAGVYGVVESIENTTDGKVVTIKTGDEKHPCTMTIHINAIGGIDNKTIVVENETESKVDVTDQVVEEKKTVDNVADEVVDKNETKKTSKTTAKKTTKK